jgi:hypothetical protein
MRAPVARTTHAKSLQRREGKRPVGNSRKTKGSKTIISAHPEASTALTVRGGRQRTRLRHESVSCVGLRKPHEGEA